MGRPYADAASPGPAAAAASYIPWRRRRRIIISDRLVRVRVSRCQAVAIMIPAAAGAPGGCRRRDVARAWVPATAAVAALARGPPGGAASGFK